MSVSGHIKAINKRLTSQAKKWRDLLASDFLALDITQFLVFITNTNKNCETTDKFLDAKFLKEKTHCDLFNNAIAVLLKYK